jgi:hypothetical protein
VTLVSETARIESRLAEATTLTELLTAAFDAFEVIRSLARDCEDHGAELLATYMTIADTAVDGREAVTAAHSVTSRALGTLPEAVSTDQAAGIKADDRMAGLGALLATRLGGSAGLASASGDLAACRNGAGAARRICSLLARDDHDRCPG